MWTKTLIGSFKYSRKTIRTVYYTLLLITEIAIDAIESFLCKICCMSADALMH